MGYFIIQSPSRGTWDIVAEVNDETVMNRSGVSQGEKIPFKVKTSLWGETKLSISITWSNRANTTLTAHVHASYWACGQDSVFLFFCFVFFFSGVKYLCIYFSTIPTSYYEIILCASHYYWLCIWEYTRVKRTNEHSQDKKDELYAGNRSTSGMGLQQVQGASNMLDHAETIWLPLMLDSSWLAFTDCNYALGPM